MALDPSSGFAAAAEIEDDSSLPIFDVQRVQLQFSIAASFVAAQVANNVLVLALSNGRILRIDLNRPEDIDDIDLPKRPSEVGVIQRMFLDPTASHLIICTALGESYYLHSQSRQPRQLARLRGISVQSIAWNPSLPTSSTREILIGAADGNIYETYLETSTEFYRKEDKYLKNLAHLSDGPITGLWVDALPARTDQYRRVLVSTPSRLLHWAGKIGRAQEGGASIYTRLFDAEQPVIHESATPSGGSGSVASSASTPSPAPASSSLSPSALVVSPDPEASRPYEEAVPDRAFAWLSAQGVYHGKLLVAPTKPELGSMVFAESKLIPRTQLATSLPDTSSWGRKRGGPEAIEAIALTQWHVIGIVGSRVVAANRLTGTVVYDQAILDQGDKAIGLCVDLQKSTFWLFTSQEIFEVVVRDEDRDVWKIMLQLQQFDAAMQYAHSAAQRDAVATASGDYLMGKGMFDEASGIYGKSSKPFEDVALALIDRNQPDALRKYLLTKLGTYKKTAIMQRMMIASWLVEIFMAKLNSLDDSITTRAELSATRTPAETRDQLRTVRDEYQSFVVRNKADLDRKTVYDIISSHGREEELLFFANTINDYHYVLAYWVQREKWAEALNVLKRQTDAEAFYRYSSVLMMHVATDLVDVLMRQGGGVKPRSIIPALLEYDEHYKGPLAQNQAIRYLQYVVNQLHSADAAVHNTMVAIYAAHPSADETALLSYLESQGDDPRFDADFALRLCIQYRRVLSCVHIYTNMGQYVQAVDLALSHDAIELAAVVADRPMGNTALRKRLWLAVARKVISQQSNSSIKTAIDFLKRCDLLKIEDLIPFFPDFVVIDDFKEEICAALEDYSREIEGLKKEMDDSSQTAANIKGDIAALDHRYAIVEPGEKCSVCGLPLLSRQFFVFPCQHAFHSDCLGRRVLEQSSLAASRKIKELQVQITKGFVSGLKKDAMVAELDALVASACILCSDFAIKKIDEPFIRADENKNEWAL
ncbi:vacuolar protein sorting protein [Grosmannia clavigera kw1407]|uniref:Vacuolar protein sorting protein n=1 Tax=Grosmannia clavigera (strain kw1407 / UAMH 11150) TaxID=655863 RepID=F0XHL3_GROCL|nr:vacuolar protein sorting protein [Grosmannia clavigera kw1407]EFX02997.1 vacuolar protein sorting protein [Grosmannia clavigera kw1407]